MAFFDAMRRSIKVAPLARVLGGDFPSTDTQALVRLMSARAAAVEKLLDFCVRDRRCAAVIAHHAASREDLRKVYYALQTEAPRWHGSNYVPVSTLAFPKPLHIALAMGTGASISEVAARLEQMFGSRTYL